MSIDLKQVSELAQKYNLLLVYLFGSRATKKETILSDIDIAILIEREDEKSATSLILDLISNFTRILHSDKVDLLILNKAPLALQYNVISQGKILYQQNLEIKCSYETEIIKLYLDFKKYESEYAKSMHKRILEGVQNS